MSIDAMRRDFDHGAFDESDAHSNPIDQFKRWFDDAVAANKGEWFEPNAMTLATVDSAGFADARIVLLKSFDHNGFVFFTNYSSIKGDQLIDHPHATLVFYWPILERQVRVRGTVAKTSIELSDAYFASRPRGSQLGALASDQSSVVSNRKTLEDKLAALDKQYTDSPIPRPESWGGYRLAANSIEFWQGRTNRLHDRLRYTLETDSSNWSIERLAP
ncbi:pyridoxamine 5'-phosphate oxidase [Poriferisphaera sp. WC338]|uniref:pyridoxamine 5'-phosphate oxidase n=1 Tax=Poriferisphaera sp. WC338 TaxID=3425129 RepID=UPI003D819436